MNCESERRHSFNRCDRRSHEETIFYNVYDKDGSHLEDWTIMDNLHSDCNGSLLFVKSLNTNNTITTSHCELKNTRKKLSDLICQKKEELDLTVSEWNKEVLRKKIHYYEEALKIIDDFIFLSECDN